MVDESVKLLGLIDWTCVLGYLWWLMFLFLISLRITYSFLHKPLWIWFSLSFEGFLNVGKRPAWKFTWNSINLLWYTLSLSLIHFYGLLKKFLAKFLVYPGFMALAFLLCDFFPIYSKLVKFGSHYVVRGLIGWCSCCRVKFNGQE